MMSKHVDCIVGVFVILMLIGLQELFANNYGTGVITFKQVFHETIEHRF